MWLRSYEVYSCWCFNARGYTIGTFFFGGGGGGGGGGGVRGRGGLGVKLIIGRCAECLQPKRPAFLS